MKSLKSWFCLLLLFALSLFAKSDSYAKVILTISKPAPTPAVVVTSRVVKQDAFHLTVDMSVTNRQKTWCYVDASKRSPDLYKIPRFFLIGPSQTYTLNNVELVPSQSGSFVADAAPSKRKEIAYALGIDALYRVGMGASMPAKFQVNLWELVSSVDSNWSNWPERAQMNSSLKAYSAAFKRKDVEACAKAVQSMAYNPVLVQFLYSVDPAASTKFKDNIAKLTTTKLLAKARRVAEAQLASLSAPQTGKVTYSTKFDGPRPKLVVSNLSLGEGDGQYYDSLEVKLSSVWWEPISVSYEFINGTAKAGVNYQDEEYHAEYGFPLNFSPGETTAIIPFYILGDFQVGIDRAFTVRLSSSSKALSIPKGVPTITIVDDDKISTTPSNSGRIAYQLNGDICVMNADGTNKTRLTNDGRSYDPAFSPDGGQIAFTSFRKDGSGIYVMNADGTNQTRLTAVDSSSPSFSADGSKIVFSVYGDVFDQTIYVMNADGTDLKQLTVDGKGIIGNRPTFSPDGTKIAFDRYNSFVSSDHVVYVMGIDGSDLAPLNNLRAASAPTFSPDGSKIIFSLYNYPYKHLYSMNADGTDARQLTASKQNDYDSSPTFSPDGSKIAFARWGDRDIIYSMNSNGTRQTTIADGDNPSWGLGFVPAPGTPAPASPAHPTSPSGGAS